MPAATVADFRNDLEAAILAAVPGTTFTTDPISDDVAFASPGTKAQISAIPAFGDSRLDMSQRVTVLWVRTRVVQLRNAPGGTFEAWMEGDGATLATLLSDPATYLALASVVESNVEDRLEVSQVYETEGFAAWFEVGIGVALRPA